METAVMIFAVVNGTSNNVSIFLNDGSGLFSLSSTVGVGNYPWWLTSGDFNNDGSIDLAVANWSSNTVSILINDGQAHFSQATTISVGVGTLFIVCSDLNSDGYQDLITANYYSNTISVLKNNGNLTFTKTNFSVGTNPYSITTGDFNNDGTIDVAVGNYGEGGSQPYGVTILTNDGNANLSQTQTLSNVGHPRSITSGDFNNDGNIDFAIGDESNNRVLIYQNNGVAFFSLLSEINGTYITLTVNDVNGDGNLDIATINGFYKNDGTGNFISEPFPPVGDSPNSVAVADYNGDGIVDISITNNNSGTVSVLHQNIQLAASKWKQINYGDANWTALASIELTEVVGVNWGYGSPTGTPSDYFSVQYIGNVYCDTVGIYQISSDCIDDEAWINIDGQDRFYFSMTGIRVSTISLTAGFHTFNVRYREGYGLACMTLNWMDSFGNQTRIQPSIIDTQNIIENSSLVAYYPFNENANDESGNGSNGTMVGGITLASDRFGQPNKAFSFDGSTGYIDVPSSNHPLGNVTVTYSCWIKPITDTSTYWKAIIDAGSLGGFNRSALMAEAPNYYLVSYTVDGGRYVEFSYALVQDQWTHLIFSKLGDTTSLYVNGLLIGTSLFVSGQDVISTRIRIGGPGSGHEYYHGIIDDIRIYSKSLNQSEIDSLYHEGGWFLPTVSIDYLESHQNDTIAVPVRVNFPQGKSYSSAELSFDGYQEHGLTFLGVDTISSLIGANGWQLQINNTDTLLITASAGSQDISGSGALFNLKFLVTGDVCSFAPITFQKALFNSGSDYVTTTNGGVAIKPIPVYGDVDNNGWTQAFDASLILKHIVGIDTLECQSLANANVSCDSTISAYDATIILKSVIGLIDSLPYCNSVEATGNITMIPFTVQQGGIVDIPIYLSNGGNIFSFEGMITYDPNQLTFDQLIWSPLLNQFSKEAHVKNGEIQFAGAGSTSDGEANTFMSLRFVKTLQNGQSLVTLKQLRWNEGEVKKNVATSTIITDVKNDKSGIPMDFSLEQNYPNPFNPSPVIRYQLPTSQFVSLGIYDLLGREVAELVNEYQIAGYREITFNAESLTSGIYVYKMTAGKYSNVKKLLLLR
ncbi:MAG: VCBS repeat-containing protein [Ignavibacteriae bacterium]|nr:VCBS repeat-containing protein [Ignavibacteriota bacterium]